MKRINIRYGAQDYSVGGRDLEDLQQEITIGLSRGGVHWLLVNEGLGNEQPAYLALTTGVPIALAPIREDGPATS
jgi:hypothetical protein